MWWPWKSQSSAGSEEGKSTTDLLDPSLREFYDQEKPPTPLALAGERERKAFEEQKKVYEHPQSAKDQVAATSDNDQRMVRDFTGKKMVPLGQAARNNCVEYEVLLANCSFKGTFWEKLNMCHMYRKQQMKCVELQTEALKKLGYESALTRNDQEQVQNHVDDIFCQTVPDGPITDEVATKFENAVQQAKGEGEIFRV